MFDVDWNRIIELNIQSFFKKVKHLAWLQALIKPVKTVHSEFKILIDDLLFKLNFTSQIIYLEHILNVTFDPTNKAIFIENVDNDNPVVMFRKIEQKQAPVLFRKSEGQPGLVMKTRAEFDGVFDFIVNVPIGVAFDEDEMRGLVNLYRLAGMRYTIVTF